MTLPIWQQQLALLVATPLAFKLAAIVSSAQLDTARSLPGFPKELMDKAKRESDLASKKPLGWISVLLLLGGVIVGPLTFVYAFVVGDRCVQVVVAYLSVDETIVGETLKQLDWDVKQTRYYWFSQLVLFSEALLFGIPFGYQLSEHLGLSTLSVTRNPTNGNLRWVHTLNHYYVSIMHISNSTVRIRPSLVAFLTSLVLFICLSFPSSLAATFILAFLPIFIVGIIFSSERGIWSFVPIELQYKISVVYRIPCGGVLIGWLSYSVAVYFTPEESTLSVASPTKPFKINPDVYDGCLLLGVVALVLGTYAPLPAMLYRFEVSLKREREKEMRLSLIAASNKEEDQSGEMENVKAVFWKGEEMAAVPTFRSAVSFKELFSISNHIYSTIATVALVLTTFLFPQLLGWIYKDYVDSLSTHAAVTFQTHFFQLLSIPLSYLALLISVSLVANLRGDLGKLWAYKEIWGSLDPSAKVRGRIGEEENEVLLSV